MYSAINDYFTNKKQIDKIYAASALYTLTLSKLKNHYSLIKHSSFGTDV